MPTTIEIVNAISGIVSEYGYDGAIGNDGAPVKVGLRREEGDPILDKRVIDGFGVKFIGNHLMITYQSEIKLSEIYKGDLEAETEQMIQDIANFIKKQCKAVSNINVRLTPLGEVHVRAENTSRVRYFVTAHRTYKIGNMKGTDPILGESGDSVDKKFRDFLELGGLGQRPPNDTRRE
tara:strand:- start:2342 stop:2875 length:534 start_codon:yes stop_codon:yes gene_type:complete